MTMILLPDDPRAWPSATAPPDTLSLSLGMSRIFWLAMATAEKASLTSNLATWSIVMPARLSAAGMAFAGAIGKSMGAQAASAKAVYEERASVWARARRERVRKRKTHRRPWRGG